jgi:hypothetical protein
MPGIFVSADTFPNSSNEFFLIQISSMHTKAGAWRTTHLHCLPSYANPSTKGLLGLSPIPGPVILVSADALPNSNNDLLMEISSVE